MQRRPDRSDRRRIIVEATAQTRRRDAEVFGARGSTSEELAASYSDKKLRVITDFLRRSRSAIAVQGDALAQPETRTTSKARARR